MKRILFLLFCISHFMISCAQDNSGNIKNVQAKEFQTLMAQPEAIVLDVRTPEEVAEGKIANALNIDYKGADFEKQIAKLDKNKTYLVYCRSGRRSTSACEAMTQAGFKHVINLEGGILQWQEAQLPVTSK